jgi:prephenate dehydrogenase
LAGAWPENVSLRNGGLNSMPENSPAAFRRVAVIGTGLVGGSFALAVRRHLPDAHVVGFDREPVLQSAKSAGVIHEGHTEISAALRGADLIYLALPISSAIELLREIARHAEPGALVTDACSTKRAVCRAASHHFHAGENDRSAIFLGGHPMAGRELHGVEAAGADLFRGAKYALIREEGNPREREPRIAAFLALLEKIHAHPVWLDAETHDWAVAIISHLPQMAAVALAEVIAAETDESGLPASLAGPGARDMLRLAGSPYSMWRDIAFSNSDNLSRALDRLSQAIDQLRTHLTSRDLESSFAEANRVQKTLFR